jgi:flavin reductase (DIM6/NTAB) family NADH-FMN oxidoreductase RutF
MSSVAGGYIGSENDKISTLKELGFEFHKAKRISSLKVKGAALNMQFKLYKEMTLGDHITFVGTYRGFQQS